MKLQELLRKCDFDRMFEYIVETSIKRMRIFYEAWCSMFENPPLSADDLQNSIIPVGDNLNVSSDIFSNR